MGNNSRGRGFNFTLNGEKISGNISPEEIVYSLLNGSSYSIIQPKGFTNKAIPIQFSKYIKNAEKILSDSKSGNNIFKPENINLDLRKAYGIHSFTSNYTPQQTAQYNLSGVQPNNTQQTPNYFSGGIGTTNPAYMRLKGIDFNQDNFTPNANNNYRIYMQGRKEGGKIKNRR